MGEPFSEQEMAEFVAFAGLRYASDSEEEDDEQKGAHANGGGEESGRSRSGSSRSGDRRRLRITRQQFRRLPCWLGEESALRVRGRVRVRDRVSLLRLRGVIEDHARARPLPLVGGAADAPAAADADEARDPDEPHEHAEHAEQVPRARYPAHQQVPRLRRRGRRRRQRRSRRRATAPVDSAHEAPSRRGRPHRHDVRARVHALDHARPAKAAVHPAHAPSPRSMCLWVPLDRPWRATLGQGRRLD